VLFTVAVLFAANYGYGLAHEAAHAAVIDALGGHVSGIYVNALGTDAYIEHTPLAGTADLVLVNVAGLAVTTALALVFAAAGQGLLATFLAARTAIYALNYTPGTDISTIYAVAGNASIFISLFVVAINFACIYLALKPAGISFIASHRLRVRSSRQIDGNSADHVYGSALRQALSQGE
jgi:hypothetical protein